jgi:hypothetical protein
LQGKLLTEEEKNKNFFEADQKIRKAVSEFEHLRRKGRKIADFCEEVRNIFGRTHAEEMATNWEVKLSSLHDRFNPWPDISESALTAFVSAIREQEREVRESQEEMNKLRGLT